MTWGITALGGACVVLMPFLSQLFGTSQADAQRKILDVALGFASGVMLAASFFSLLEPAAEMARENPTYGDSYAWVPPAIGFSLGAVFILGCDVLLSKFGIADEEDLILASALGKQPTNHNSDSEGEFQQSPDEVVVILPSNNKNKSNNLRQRKPFDESNNENAQSNDFEIVHAKKRKNEEWKRVLLLVLAVTVHNFPEGLAVGVGFGSVGKSATATFERARNLAIGIGLQNFPEGLAVSMPLYRHGQSLWKCVFWGQLSGMVEPIGGLLGAWAVTHVEPLLPYALAFAAGAMIYVVVDSLVPEVVVSGNREHGTWGCMIGFVIMMTLDLGL